MYLNYNIEIHTCKMFDLNLFISIPVEFTLSSKRCFPHIPTNFINHSSNKSELYIRFALNDR